MAKMATAEIIWKDRKHWLWFPFSFTKYQVSYDRLYVQSGFFNTVYDEVLLYRIVDLRMTRTLGQKICGTGTIEVFTRVDTQKVMKLKNIRHCAEVNRLLSGLVEDIRNEKKVVGKEFYGAMAPGGRPPMGLDDDDDCDCPLHEHDDMEDEN